MGETNYRTGQKVRITSRVEDFNYGTIGTVIHVDSDNSINIRRDDGATWWFDVKDVEPISNEKVNNMYDKIVKEETRNGDTIDCDYTDKDAKEKEDNEIEDQFASMMPTGLKKALVKSQSLSLARRKSFDKKIKFIKGLITSEAIRTHVQNYGAITINDTIKIEESHRAGFMLSVVPKKLNKLKRTFNWSYDTCDGRFDNNTYITNESKNLPVMYLSKITNEETMDALKKGIIDTLQAKIKTLEDKTMIKEIENLIRETKGLPKMPLLLAIGTGYAAGTQNDKIKAIAKKAITMAKGCVKKADAWVNKDGALALPEPKKKPKTRAKTKAKPKTTKATTKKKTVASSTE